MPIWRVVLFVKNYSVFCILTVFLVVVNGIVRWMNYWPKLQLRISIFHDLIEFELCSLLQDLSPQPRYHNYCCLQPWECELYNNFQYSINLKITASWITALFVLAYIVYIIIFITVCGSVISELVKRQWLWSKLHTLPWKVR